MSCFWMLCGLSIWALSVWGQDIPPAPTAASTFTTIDGQSFPAIIRRIQADGSIEFRSPGKLRTVPAHRLWSWGQWRGRHLAPQLLLTDGSWLTVADPLGRGVAVDPQSPACQFATRFFGVCRIPPNDVVGAVLVWPSDPQAADRLADRLGTTIAEDTVGLVSGDEFRGRIRSWTAEACRVVSGERTWDIPAAQVGWVQFADKVTKEAPALSTWVGLADASCLHAESIVWEDGRLSIQLVSDWTLHEGAVRFPLDAFESIQRAWPRQTPTMDPSRRGAVGATLLSQQLPLSLRQQGWMIRSWPLGINRTPAGGWLRCQEAAFRYGLSMHAPAEADYELLHSYRWFAAQLGLDSSAGDQGSVIFRLMKRNRSTGEWITAFQSHVLRGGDAAVPCRVDLYGASEIRLAVDVADHGHVLDRALWLDARLCQ